MTVLMTLEHFGISIPFEGQVLNNRASVFIENNDFESLRSFLFACKNTSGIMKNNQSFIKLLHFIKDIESFLMISESKVLFENKIKYYEYYKESEREYSVLNSAVL